MRNKKMSEIIKPLEVLKLKARLKEELDKYFYIDSKLCRATQIYLSNDPECHCYNRLGRQIEHNSAHYSASLKDVSMYVPLKDSKDIEHIIFQFALDLTDPDQGTTVTKHITVSFPSSWETNFSQRKFDAWARKGKKGIKENKDMQSIITIGKKSKISSYVVDTFISNISHNNPDTRGVFS